MAENDRHGRSGLPSNIAPLLVWQQPHIIYMLEMAYRRKRNRRFLEENWELVKETADSW